MESCIARIEAVADLKALSVATACQSEDGARNLQSQLTESIGTTIVRKEKLDKKGLHALKGQNTAK